MTKPAPTPEYEERRSKGGSMATSAANHSDERDATSVPAAECLFAPAAASDGACLAGAKTLTESKPNR